MKSMERQASALKSKGTKILKFLPKAAQAAVSFQNPPFSPGLEKKLRTPSSGPIFSMFPIENRQGSKNFDTQEPTSPKVSCIGQVRHHKAAAAAMSKKSHVIRPDRVASIPARPELESPAPPEMNKKPPRMPGIKRINSIFLSRRKSDAARAPPLTERAPSLSQMKRFASSRDALADFDWRSGELSTAPGAGDDYLGCKTDGGRDIVVMPFTAPIVVAGVRAGKGATAVVGAPELRKPKEINLWKRRAMVAQPPPLQLNLVRAQ